MENNTDRTEIPDSATSLIAGPAPGPDSAPTLIAPGRLEVAARKAIRVATGTLKILMGLILLPFLLMMPVACGDLQVVSIVGDSVIRYADIAVSMETAANMLVTKNPDWRYVWKRKQEEKNLGALETKLFRSYLERTGDTAHVLLSDTEMHAWGRSAGSVWPDKRLIRHPMGLQGYRWWMKENQIVKGLSDRWTARWNP